MKRAPGAAAALAAVALLLPTGAGAETFRDDATGLTVVLPDGVRATRAERPGYDVTVTLDSDLPRRRIGTDTGLCQAGFVRAPGNAALTQDEINAASVTPDRLEMIRAGIGRAFDVTSVEPVTWGAAKGVEVIGTPRMGPGAEDARAMLSMAETPRGRVVLSCVAHVADTPALFEVFRSLRAAVKPPA